MWLYKFIVFACVLGVSACGFKPAYAPDSLALGLYNATTFTNPTDTTQFQFTSQLERRLGRASNPRYTLDWTLDVSDKDYTARTDQVPEQHKMTGSVHFSLHDQQTDKVLLSKQETNFVVYLSDATQTDFKTGRADAQRRLAILLADGVVMQLLALE